MFTKILAYFSIFLGILWTVRPDALRNWFVRKTFWHLFFLFFGLMIGPLTYLVHAIGLLRTAGILLVLGVALKAVRVALAGLFQKIPSAICQAIGVLNILTGIFLLYKKP